MSLVTVSDGLASYSCEEGYVVRAIEQESVGVGHGREGVKL